MYEYAAAMSAAAAAAPAARGTETGRCSQDKDNTAWFAAPHSGREYFKLQRLLWLLLFNSIETPPLWPHCDFYLFFYFCPFLQISC